MRKQSGFTRPRKALARMGLSLAMVMAAGFCRAADGDGTFSRPGDEKPGVESVRSGVNRALPLLIKASAQEYPKHRECFSCHNQAVPAVKSPSRPFQPYFESGFPHAPDQFISAVGSGWATAALVLACPRF
jgi:hypothetical protein